jgi:hypothetical protein
MSRLEKVTVAALIVIAAGCANDAPPPKDVPAAAGAEAPAKPAATADPGEAGTSKAPPKIADLVPPIPNEPVASPFGDPWDPTKPKPEAPPTSGPGITGATLVAAGAATVKELPLPPGSAPAFYAVVADVTIAPGSTTDVLGTSSITLEPAAGEATPLFAACMPTLEDAELINQGEGTALAGWTVSIGAQTWQCRGRTARMLRRVGPGGFKLTGPAAAAWTGPMLMLFEAQAEPPKSVSIAGKAVDLSAAPNGKKS